MPTNSKIALITIRVLVAGIVIFGTHPGFARDKYETIDAQAWGTSTQMGQSVGVTLSIYEYSAPADKALLLEAFEKGKNQGLVNALQKMKAVGRVSITGTLGYDCAYIKMSVTPTGRRIVFITNRLLRFGEAFFDTQSQSYNLTAGMIEINDQDKSKSTGTLYPAAQLVVNKQHELEWDLTQNPWRLSDIIDWAGTQGVN
jgi:hypothetical protein